MIDQSKPTNWLLLAAAIIIIIAGLKMAAPLIVPFMLSVFIALICSPLLAWLKSKGAPSAVAITLVVVAIMVAALLVGMVVGSSINDFRQDIPLYQSKITHMLTSSVIYLGSKGINLDLEQIRSSFDPGVVMQIAGNTFASLSNMMTNFFMILLTVIFILAEEVSFSDKLASARGESREMTAAMQTFTQSVNRYLGIKTILSLITGVAIVLWLWILGVDYPLVWGLLAFLLNFIPTVGSILAAVPPVLLALVQVSPFVAALTAAGFMVVNIVTGNIMEPKMLGRELNLSPLVVFLSLVFWGWVLGAVGMLLSIPLTMIVKIILENDEKTRWIGIMLGGRRSEPVAVASPD